MKCRLIDVDVTERESTGEARISRIVDRATGERPVPGDMYFHPWCLEHSRDALSAYYFAHNADRPPLCVVLPTGMHFIIDGAFFDREKGYHGGWTVTGTPPAITVSPSINVVGHWHGWLEHGEMRPA